MGKSEIEKIREGALKQILASNNQTQLDFWNGGR